MQQLQQSRACFLATLILFFITIPVYAAPPVNLYTFGDSYASGVGAMQYIPETDINNINQCHRAETAYGPLLARRLGLSPEKNFHFPACGGAKTENIYNIGQWNEKPQILGVPAIPRGQRGIATLSIGGNDLGFAPVITHCITSLETISGAPADLSNLNDVIDCQDATPTDDPGSIFLQQIETNLERVTYSVAENVEVIQKYLNRRGGKVELFIIGYPELFNDRVEVCGNGAIELEPGLYFDALLSQGERKYFNEVAVRLNKRLYKVANNFKNVHYIDVNRYFEGHRMCDPDPYINPITLMPSSNTAHPNEIGHRVMYKVISRHISHYLYQRTPLSVFQRPLTLR